MSRMQAAVLPAAILASLIAVLLAFKLPPRAAAHSDALLAGGASPSTIPAEPQTSAPCAVSKDFPQAVLAWCELITRAASDQALDPDMLAAVMLIESGGDSRAYSTNGAVGLMQVMPRDGLASEFMCPNGPCFASRPTIAELMEPEFNLAYAAGMLADLASRTGSLREALLHYGPIEVGYAYADTVIQIWEKYR